jgi:hypothetical protein
MKISLYFLTLLLSLSAFAQAPYEIERNRWGHDIVSFPGATADLFATHELLATRGPNWKKLAENFVEEETDAVEILGKIEDGTLSEHCDVDWDSIDSVENEGLSYKWSALKPLRTARAKTILYTISTYGDYVIRLENGKKVACPFLINEYVFLNQKSGNKPFKFLGVTE